MQRTVSAIRWPLPSGLADSLCQGQPDSLAHRLTACLRGDVSRDSSRVWAAGADDGWVSCMLCSWDRALCCTLESVLSKGAQVLWAPDPLLQEFTSSPGLFLLAFSVSSELFPSPSLSSCLNLFSVSSSFLWGKSQERLQPTTLL